MKVPTERVAPKDETRESDMLALKVVADNRLDSSFTDDASYSSTGVRKMERDVTDSNCDSNVISNEGGIERVLSTVTKVKIEPSTVIEPLYDEEGALLFENGDTKRASTVSKEPKSKVPKRKSHLRLVMLNPQKNLENVATAAKKIENGASSEKNVDTAAADDEAANLFVFAEIDTERSVLDLEDGLTRSDRRSRKDLKAAVKMTTHLSATVEGEKTKVEVMPQDAGEAVHPSGVQEEACFPKTIIFNECRGFCQVDKRQFGVLLLTQLQLAHTTEPASRTKQPGRYSLTSMRQSI